MALDSHAHDLNLSTNESSVSGEIWTNESSVSGQIWTNERGGLWTWDPAQSATSWAVTDPVPRLAMQAGAAEGGSGELIRQLIRGT